MQSVQDECREIPEIQNDRGWGGVLKMRSGALSEVTNGGGEEDVGKESLMMELTRLVQKVMKESSWWEKRGVDCSILTAAFLSLVPAFLLLGSSQLLWFSLGMLLMGLAHAIITVKGTHLASHGALCESHTWAKFWAIFFIEICSSFSAQAGIHGHIKMHHAHTNIIGLGDSSVWKIPFLPRIIYLFMAPLSVPVITPLVALAHWSTNVLSNKTAEEDLPDDPRSSEPAPQPYAGLDVWTLSDQLPRRTPPLPLSVRQHVFKGEACCVQVPD